MSEKPMTVRKVMVREYESAKEFERDAKILLKQGWRVASTTQLQPRPGIGRFVLLGPAAMVFRPKDKIIVTYERDEPVKRGWLGIWLS